MLREQLGPGVDRLMTLVELLQVTHDGRPGGRGEHPGADVADADEEHGGHSGSTREPDQDVEAAFQAGESKPNLHAFRGATDEALLFPRFLAEGLDDAQGP